MNSLFAAIVYSLCFVASSACAWLLGRSYLRSRARLLLWSCVSFLFLAGSNLLLVIDLVVLPFADLRILRLLLALGAAGTLIFAFIWNLEGEEQ